MDKPKKFNSFLESLKGKGQDKLIESIKHGFHVCFENEMMDMVKKETAFKEKMENPSEYDDIKNITQNIERGGDVLHQHVMDKKKYMQIYQVYKLLDQYFSEFEKEIS